MTFEVAATKIGIVWRVVAGVFLCRKTYGLIGFIVNPLAGLNSLFKRLVLIWISFLFVSCDNMPNDAEVKSDFLTQHPAWRVVSVGIGEGDGAAGYFHIRYTKPGDQQIYEEVWQYLKDSNGSWKVNYKEGERLVPKR